MGGLLRSWDSFASGISVSENAPNFDKLWATCTKKESRLYSRGDIEDPSIEAFVAHAKGNEKKPNFGKFHRSLGKRYRPRFVSKKDSTSQIRSPPPSRDRRNRRDKRDKINKRDLSNIQCFRCQAYGHYQVQCH